MIAKPPRWLEHQPVTTYYDEEKQEPYRHDYYITQKRCGICNRRFYMPGKRYTETIGKREIRGKGSILCGKINTLLWLHLFVCTGCFLKYRFKEYVGGKQNGNKTN